MTLTAVCLIIVSAFIHASWNLLCKKTNPSASFFLLATFASCIILTPFVFSSFRLIRIIPPGVWFFLTVTGFFMSLYYVSLGKAYKSGGISIVYPVARTLPVLIVSIAVYIISGGTQYMTYKSAFGALLIVTGCFMLPMEHFRDFRFKNYLNTSCFFAIVAAIGTAGYSIIDDRATAILRTELSSVEGITYISLLYIFLEMLFTLGWMGIYVLFDKNESKLFRTTIRKNKTSAAIAGCAITLAYSMILISMAFVSNVSYVVAFRQLGILIGAILGIVLLGESKRLPKFAGIFLMFTGLLLVALG